MTCKKMNILKLSTLNGVSLFLGSIILTCWKTYASCYDLGSVLTNKFIAIILRSDEDFIATLDKVKQSKDVNIQDDNCCLCCGLCEDEFSFKIKRANTNDDYVNFYDLVRSFYRKDNNIVSAVIADPAPWLLDNLAWKDYFRGKFPDEIYKLYIRNCIKSLF